MENKEKIAIRKNYQKKKRQEITKKIILGLLATGGIAVASTDPQFLYRLLPKIAKYISWKIQNPKEKKKLYDTFSRLKRDGLVHMEYSGRQLHIYLTEEGREKAGKYQIDDLEIKKPLRWDKKWRILIFDIEDKNKVKREALRGKLKELGLYQLQKSVWICPYHFQNEITLLKEFFGFAKGEMKVIVASEIEDDQKARAFFRLKQKQK